MEKTINPKVIEGIKNFKSINYSKKEILSLNLLLKDEN